MERTVCGKDELLLANSELGRLSELTTANVLITHWLADSLPLSNPMEF